MKRPPRSKLEQRIRDLKLREWPSARMMRAELAAEAAEAALAAERAERERWAKVVAENEERARALVSRWLADGLQDFVARGKKTHTQG